MDNASVNDKTLEELAILLQEREIDFDPIDRRIMCIPHVVHIATTHVLDKFFPRTNRLTTADVPQSMPDEDDLEDFAPAAPMDAAEETYEDAVARNPPAILRALIRAIRASGQRRTEFLDHIV